MTCSIEWHEGLREDLRDLFELAEDSRVRLDGYLDHGRVLVARDDRGGVVGHLQLVSTASPDVVAIKNVAVRPDTQRRGIGRRLVERALEVCTAEGAHTVTVATAAADLGNLRFYQRCGFRVASVERDAFTEADGYPPGLTTDGIPVLDAIHLAAAVSAADPVRRRHT